MADDAPKTRKGGRKKMEGGPARVVAIRVPLADFALISIAAAHDRRTVSSFLAVAGIERAERIMSEGEGPEED